MTASLMVGQDAGEVPGAAPGVQVVPIAISGSTASMADAIYRAADYGAQIINVSSGVICPERELDACDGVDVLTEAVNYAEAHGAVVIGSAGNNAPECHPTEFTNSVRLPGALRNAISVGAHDRDGQIGKCSSRRNDVDVLAPGVGLLAAIPPREDPEIPSIHGYTIVTGTSFSAPVLSGYLAALLASTTEEISPVVLRDLIRGWTDEQGRLDSLPALARFGLVDPEDLVDGGDALPPHVEALHTLQVGFNFETGHRVDGLLREFYNGALDIPGVDVIPALHPGAQHRTESVPFGWLEADIYLFKDGTASASATWLGDHILTYGGNSVMWQEWYGFTAWCDVSVGQEFPGLKNVRWDLPVDIDGQVPPARARPGRHHGRADHHHR